MIASKTFSKFQGYFFILLAATLWGSIGPLAKLAFAQGVTPLEAAFYRAMFGWCFFFVHALVKRSIKIELRELPLFFVFSFFCVTLFFLSYQLAVARVGASLASVLLYTAPAWVIVLARVFLGEKISPLKLIALALTLVGVYLISFSGKDVQVKINYLGIFFGLLSGFTYALYYILGKKILTHYNSFTIFTYILPLGCLPLFFFLPSTLPSNQALFTLFCLGFATTYLAYLSYYQGLKYLEASKASMVATIEPVVASLLAFFFWGEVLSFTGYMGAVLILVAVVLTIRL